MRTFLIVAEVAWFILAGLMTFSLALVARRRMPWPAALASTSRVTTLSPFADDSTAAREAEHRLEEEKRV